MTVSSYEHRVPVDIPGDDPHARLYLHYAVDEHDEITWWVVAAELFSDGNKVGPLPIAGWEDFVDEYALDESLRDANNGAIADAKIDAWRAA